MADTIIDYDVYISYHVADQQWVQQTLVPRLIEQGISVVPPIEVGESTIRYTEKSIEQSRHTLAVCTPSYVQDVWGEFEQTMIQILDPLNIHRRLLPLVRIPCSLPHRIRTLHYADFTAVVPDADTWAALFQTLTTGRTKTSQRGRTPAWTILRQRIGSQRSVWVMRSIGAVALAAFIIWLILAQAERLITTTSMIIGDNNHGNPMINNGTINHTTVLSAPTTLATPTPTVMPKSMSPDHFNIVVADFGDSNGVLGSTLAAAVETLNEYGSQLDPIHVQQIHAVHDQAQASQLAHMLNARILLWGKAAPDSTKVQIQFTVLDQEGSTEIPTTFNTDDLHEFDSQRTQWRTTVIAYFLQGLKALDDQQPAQAEASFRSALTWLEQHPAWQNQNRQISDTLSFYLGRSLVAQGNYTAGIDTFSKTLQINPKYTWAQLGIGTTYFSLAMQEQPPNKDILEQALAAYQATIALYEAGDDPAFPPQDAFVLAKTYYNQGNAYLALARIETTSSAGGELTYGLARSAYGHALAHYTRLQQRGYQPGKHLALVRYGLGVVDEEQAQPEAALQHYQDCVNLLTPSNPTTNAVRALCEKRAHGVKSALPEVHATSIPD